MGILEDEYRDRPIVGRIEIAPKNDRYPAKKSGGSKLQLLKDNYHITFKPLNKKIPWFKLG